MLHFTSNKNVNDKETRQNKIKIEYAFSLKIFTLSKALCIYAKT